MEYLHIILEGYAKRRKYLADYLAEECKKVMDNGINDSEFIDGIFKAMSILLNEQMSLFTKRCTEVKMLNNFRSSKGEPLIPMPKREQFNLNVSHLTNLNYFGNISLYDILYIDGEILKFVKRKLSDWKLELSDLKLNAIKAKIGYLEAIKASGGTNNILDESDNKEIKKYNAIHYALAYFFDCEAIGDKKYEKQTQAKTESDLYQYSKSKPTPNTMRKKLDQIKPKGNKIFNIDTLTDIAGNDWRSTILELCKQPEKVKILLKSKQL